ncbi:MAG: peptidase T [Sphingobacteriales bacterium]|nr:peptidase T [Sphingobacteriales bacterium]
MNLNYTVTDRFLMYVKIDTQSDPNSPTCPSTEKQKNLGKILVEELLAIGIVDAEMDENGYVYATLPSNTDKKIPVICFCSHMDTSPDCTGKDVNPIIHKNYDGKDIVLPQDLSQILRTAEHPALLDQVGNDIITADGTTLLGADNKAGVAEIMDAVYQLINNPSIKHGDIKILFTPDEEIGRGADKVNLTKLCADFAYTMDGETRGHIEDETFSADGLKININGVASHPGFAKDKMENAIKIASDIIAALPKDTLSPETTTGREGFVHPVSITGGMESASIQFIIRDFETAKLKVYEQFVEDIANQVIKNYPGSTFVIEVTNQYRNMKEVLMQNPQLVSYAEEAIRRAGMNPVSGGIRGGTDGSRFSFMGLPCPNIFAGEHAFHSKLEWVSVQDMELAVDTIIHLVQIWEEKG